MDCKLVRTQAEFDEAIKAGFCAEVTEGEFSASGAASVYARGSASVRASGSASVRASDSVTVHAWDSAIVHAFDSATVHALGSAIVHALGSATVHTRGSATVRAWDSATVHASGSATVRAFDSAIVRAFDSATVHAFDSATVHALGSATVHARDLATVHALGSATVHARDLATVRASTYVAVTIAATFKGQISGGRQIRIPKLKTIEEWCAFHGLKAINGVVVLYKGVGTDYKSIRGGDYTPGTTPEAYDWDGGKQECGRGLHFSPSPMHTLEFNSCVKKFIACPVKAKDIVIHPDGQFPQKVKARCCCAPVWEVDIDGKRIDMSAIVAARRR